MSPLATLAYFMVLQLAPPAEDLEKDTLRYSDIADAVGEACSDSKAPKRCVALMVAIGAQSRFSEASDVGPCDGCSVASVWQLQPGQLDGAGKPITLARLFENRQLAAWLALRNARASLARCGHPAAPPGGSCRPSKTARQIYTAWKALEAQ